MQSKIAIYLAGSIKKGHEQSNESYWTEADLVLLKNTLHPYDVSFLNPAFRMDDLSDQQSVFGRDMLQVFCSHFVFVDARDRRGLGVGAEMMWAKLNKIPIVTWAPRNSHYHKDHATILGVSVQNFMHPFIESLSDKIVENLEDGGKWIQETISNSAIKIKGIEAINAAMEYYKNSQLKHDKPMQDLIVSCTELANRVQGSPPPKI